jgi:hypothetical protein
MKRLLASSLLGALVLTTGVGWADGPSGARVAKSSESSDESRAVKDGRAVLGLMEGSARGLSDLLGRARRTQDTRAIACVSDSLSQANVLTRRAKERFGMLREAVQRGDASTQALLLALMQEDRAMEREATKTAFACVGVLTVPRGKDLVTVKVIVDKSIPPETAEPRSE